jgi:hypothetical protein
LADLKVSKVTNPTPQISQPAAEQNTAEACRKAGSTLLPFDICLLPFVDAVPRLLGLI